MNYFPPQAIYASGRDFEAMRKVPWFWKQYQEFLAKEQSEALTVLKAGGVSPENYLLELHCRDLPSDPSGDHAAYTMFSFSSKFDIDKFKEELRVTEHQSGAGVYYTLVTKRPSISGSVNTYMVGVYFPSPTIVVCAVKARLDAPFAKFEAIVARSGGPGSFFNGTLERINEVAGGHIWHASSTTAEQTTYGDDQIQLSKVMKYKDAAEANGKREFYSGIVREILVRASDPQFRKRTSSQRTPEMLEAILEAQRNTIWEVRDNRLYIAQTLRVKPFENNFQLALLYYK